MSNIEDVGAQVDAAIEALPHGLLNASESHLNTAGLTLQAAHTDSEVLLRALTSATEAYTQLRSAIASLAITNDNLSAYLVDIGFREDSKGPVITPQAYSNGLGTEAEDYTRPQTTVLYTTPERPLTTEDEWLAYLRGLENHGIQLTSPARAAKLMAALTKGKNFIETEAATQNSDYQPAKIALVATPMKDFGTAGHYEIDGQHFIGIQLDYLSGRSELDPDDVINALDHHDDVSYTGSVIDQFELAGVEEADHSRFTQQAEREGAAPEIVLDNQRTPRAQYDAQPLEYAGLQARLRYARLHNKPERTIAILQQRYDEATAYRAQHGIAS